MKPSYTYRCPLCGDARSYAPDPGEAVDCIRRPLRNPEGRVIKAACAPGTAMVIVPMGAGQ